MSFPRRRQSAFVLTQGECFFKSNTSPPHSLALSNTLAHTHTHTRARIYTPLPGQIEQIKREATTLAAHCSCRELCRQECGDSHLDLISDMSRFWSIIGSRCLTYRRVGRREAPSTILHIDVAVCSSAIQFTTFSPRDCLLWTIVEAHQHYKNLFVLRCVEVLTPVLPVHLDRVYFDLFLRTLHP